MRGREDRQVRKQVRRGKKGGWLEREVKERRSGQCLTAQTGGAAVGSAHHLYESERKQERPKVSQLASGRDCDPPIRTAETSKEGRDASVYDKKCYLMS